MKHGMAGSGPCALERIKDEIAVEYHALAEIVRPQNFLEQRFVEQAAIGSVHFLRANSQREALVQKGQRRELHDWDARRERRVDRALRRLDADPIGSLRRLSGMAEGCDALHDEWDALRQALETQGHWDTLQTQRALRLLGERDLPTLASAPRPAAVMLFSLAAGAEADPWLLARFFADPAAGPDLLPSAEEARAELRSIAEQEMAEWARRGDALWRDHDELDRASAADQALISLKPEMARLTRYANEGAGLMHRSLRMLTAHRKEQKRIEKDGGLPPPGFVGRPAQESRNEPIWTRPLPEAHKPKPDLGEDFESNSPAATPSAAPTADRGPGRPARPSTTANRPPLADPPGPSARPMPNP